MTSAAVRGSRGCLLREDSDDDIRAEQQGAFHRNGRGKKTIHKRAAFKLDGHEKPWVRARASQRREKRSASVVHEIPALMSWRLWRREFFSSSKVFTCVNRVKYFPCAGWWPGRARRASSGQNPQSWWRRQCAACRQAVRRRSSRRRSARRRWYLRRNQWECRLSSAREAHRRAQCHAQIPQPARAPRASARDSVAPPDSERMKFILRIPQPVQGVDTLSPACCIHSMPGRPRDIRFDRGMPVL